MIDTDLILLKTYIERAFAGKLALNEPVVRHAVQVTMGDLNQGRLRSAEQLAPGEWQTNDWVKKAILLFFRMQQMENMEAGPFTFYDKIPLKKDFQVAGVRVVPYAAVRFGSFCEPGVIVMSQAFINTGAFVGRDSMVDSAVVVGSCAQIGREVHLGGGVRIGGVLEPPQARPVIIEDHAFIGGGSIVYEGALVGTGAILASGCVITGSSHIIEAREDQRQGRVYRGVVPANAVLVPGSRPRQFGNYTTFLACCYIIGTRNEANDKNVSLEQALREHEVAA